MPITSSFRSAYWNRRLLRIGLSALALVIGVFLFAACGSDTSNPGAAATSTVSTTTQATAVPDEIPTSTTDVQPSAAAFATCMRSNGVPDFPDPDSESRVVIRVAPGSGLNPGSPQFQSAEEACRNLRPEQSVDSTDNSDFSQSALQFAECMRSNGVPDFPDPETSGGGIRLRVGGDVDPNSPQFQSAMEMCGNFLSGGGS